MNQLLSTSAVGHYTFVARHFFQLCMHLAPVSQWTNLCRTIVQALTSIRYMESFSEHVHSRDFQYAHSAWSQSRQYNSHGMMCQPTLTFDPLTVIALRRRLVRI